MNLSDLLKTGQIEKYKPDPEQIRNEIELARQNLAAAKKMNYLCRLLQSYWVLKWARLLNPNIVVSFSLNECGKPGKTD